MSLRFLLALALASPLAAQDLTGTVRDSASGSPLTGAIVTLSGARGQRDTRTDARGSFAFRNVDAGEYELGVRRLGYEVTSQRVSVGGEAVRRDITLRRITALDTVRVRAARQGIFGVVGTSALRPLPQATVHIAGAARIRPDSGGHFFVPIRSPGTYVVRATASGYAPQTVSVTVAGGEGVEVALLLDSATSPVGRALEMAYADFDERMKVRRPSSALVPRSELLGSGATRMLDAIRSTPSWSRPSLRFDDTACLFVDGRPRPGLALNAIDPAAVEVVEIYTAASDASGTLARRWGGQPCGDTGMPRIPRGRMENTNDLVRYVSVWLKY